MFLYPRRKTRLELKYLSYGERRSFRSAPVNLGEEYEVDVTEKSYRGDAGIAKIEGFVIIVPGSNIGDHMRVKISRIGRNYAIGDVVKAP